MSSGCASGCTLQMRDSRSTCSRDRGPADLRGWESAGRCQVKQGGGERNQARKPVGRAGARQQGVPWCADSKTHCPHARASPARPKPQEGRSHDVAIRGCQHRRLAKLAGPRHAEVAVAGVDGAVHHAHQTGRRPACCCPLPLLPCWPCCCSRRCCVSGPCTTTLCPDLPRWRRRRRCSSWRSTRWQRLGDVQALRAWPGQHRHHEIPDRQVVGEGVARGAHGDVAAELLRG